ncbi:MAG: hypothetical protein RLZZ511_2945 [Cyanobacteriota bacterium]|jgi:hypothetical protein
MASDYFYADLTAVGQFADLTDAQNYADVPNDWYAIVTDVCGSTQAIAAGRYKEVNFLGACSIIAVLNALSPFDVPFVFGGDGASLLIPAGYLPQARDALIGLRYRAHHAFAMDLRIGVVPVSLIHQHHTLKIAKVQRTATYAQASFLGGGMNYATDLIKANEFYRYDQLDPEASVDLTGMECRWEEVASRAGHTISLIVAARPNGPRSEHQIYRHVLQQINQLYGTEQTYNPIQPKALKLSFNPKNLITEVFARSPVADRCTKFAYLLRILLENAIGAVILKLRLNLPILNGKTYQQDVAQASDYQKIDDVLRMVIAGTPAQTTELIATLETSRQAGELVYGVHVSDRALMTCMIFDRHNQHIHLVDAADGGYAIAAKQLKAQLASIKAIRQPDYRSPDWEIEPLPAISPRQPTIATP